MRQIKLPDGPRVFCVNPTPDNIPFAFAGIPSHLSCEMLLSHPAHSLAFTASTVPDFALQPMSGILRRLYEPGWCGLARSEVVGTGALFGAKP